MKKVAMGLFSMGLRILSASGFPSWMGVYGSFVRHNGANPGKYTILLNQDYYGLHAKVGIAVNGVWSTNAMNYMGNIDGNSLWEYAAGDALLEGASVQYYFHAWDDENRLVAVRHAQTGELVQQNRYDGLSRRREKVEYTDGIAVTNRYIYKDWLVLAITDGAGNVLETYTHGADLSGSLGGSAGGIGGILASTQGGTVAYYHYDFNGNIVQVSNADRTPIAGYTYSPFGEVLLQDGSFTSRFQFSSKEFDALTGLNYYGYRFYSAEKGRWINRDPIEEKGGVNLYEFVFNNSLSQTDTLGLQISDFRGASPLPPPDEYTPESDGCICSIAGSATPYTDYSTHDSEVKCKDQDGCSYAATKTVHLEITGEKYSGKYSQSYFGKCQQIGDDCTGERNKRIRNWTTGGCAKGDEEEK